MHESRSDSASAPTVRLAELLASLSLAMDLGLGQPLEHVLRSCLIAQRLGEALGAGVDDLTRIYYGTLLRSVGCTSDSHETAVLAGGDDLGFTGWVAPLVMGDPGQLAAQVLQYATDHAQGGVAVATPAGVLETALGVMKAHCEVGTMIARRLGLDAAVQQALWHGFARWDGGGFPQGVAGEEIPVASRIAVLSRDTEVLTRTLGSDAAEDVIRGRAGRAYDPRLVDLLVRQRPWRVGGADGSVWQEFLAAEPGAPRMIDEAMVDRVAEVFADFADSKVPALLGHSRAVAGIVDRAAREGGCTAEEVRQLHRAALVHDLGRVGVPNGIWERNGPLTPWDWERVRLHPYLTERVLAYCGPLSSLIPVAGSHHERLDGSGYHRGSTAAALSRASRLLAAADVFAALTQPRPHRAAHSRERAADLMREEVRAGRLDRDAADAVVAVAGVRRRSASRAASTQLSEREIQVMRLVCRGHSNREIAERLTISAKTVDHHVQHIYGKTGVSTRAALAVFALERGLLQH